MYEINRTVLEGCLELIPKVFTDHRGKSIKLFHLDTFKKLMIEQNFHEDLMVTSHKGVLRGLHFQKHPFEQTKLIWCVRGSIFDVAVDLRKNSPTYGKFVCIYIDAQKHNIAYIPAGLAHGYQALEDDTTVFYKMSSVYSPEHEGGIFYDSLKIPWPIENPIISEKDLNLQRFESFASDFSW